MAAKNPRTKKNLALGRPGALLRFLYLHVIEPEHNQLSGKDEYTVMLLIPKSDKTTLKQISAEVEKFKQEVYGANVPFNYKAPIQDGDEYRSKKTGEPDKNRLGHYYMTAKSKFPPAVKKLVAGKMVDCQSEDDIYSGAYGIAAVNFYAYDSAGNTGISAGLSSICKIKDGERLGGGMADAEKDFAEMDMSEFSTDQDDFDEDLVDFDDDDLPF